MRIHTMGEKLYLELMEMFHHDDAYFLDELIEVMTGDELYSFMRRIMEKKGIDRDFNQGCGPDL